MNYRYALMFIILLQLSAVAFSSCVGYTDNFNVRVLDALGRPVPGADVWIKYDRGTTFGSQYYTTPVNKTNQDGMVPYSIVNGGTNTREIDCNIIVNGSIGGESKQITIIANQHGSIVDVQLADVYPVNFFVRDQLKAPLPNASVTLGGKVGKTDSDGKVSYYFRTGTYDYFASYQDAHQAGSLNVSNDTEYEVIFPYYKVRVEISDDNGDPIPATLSIFNNTFTVDSGFFENNRTFGESVPYSVQYKGIVNEGTIVPSVNPVATVVYDVHAPLIGNVASSVQNNRMRLSIPVSDPGKFATGVDLSSVKVTYKIEPSDATTPWNQAVTFTTGRNQLTAEFPELPANSIVDFRVEAKDKAGNRAEEDGKFSTFSESNPQNNTQNQTNTQPPSQQEQGIPLSYIIIGVIVVILAIFVVFRMKSKAGGV